MKKDTINFAILGPGRIAQVIARAIEDTRGIHKYAIGSRELDRAVAFKEAYGFEKAYGSYEEMLQDPAIDLVYIATPHGFHYEHMMMCIDYHQNILCEKAFCLTKKQAEEVLKRARQEQVFVCEALCTAFLPSRERLKELLETRIIGQVTHARGVFGVPLMHVERLVKKELGGGAILDIGIYPLYFCLSTFGKDCIIKELDVTMFGDIDESEVVVLEYPNGMTCTVEANIRESLGMYFEIFGTKGKIHIENVARPEVIEVFDLDGKCIKRMDDLRQTSGYEFELEACKRAILQNDLETQEMSHQDTLVLMEFMDAIRGIK